MTTFVTPHSRNQSHSASRSRVNVPKERFSCRLLSAHSTHAVTLALCTSNPQQQRYTISTLVSSAVGRGTLATRDIPSRALRQRRRRQCVVPQSRPGPHSY